MLINIDISLHTKTAAIGRLSGQLEFTQLPRIGESITFPLVIEPATGFNGLLTVENVIHTVNSDSNLMLSLSDIVATSEASAKTLGNSFSHKYGLFFEPYGD